MSIITLYVIGTVTAICCIIFAVNTINEYRKM